MAKKKKFPPIPDIGAAEQAVLVVSDELKNSPGFGNTVLEKVLFHADQLSFQLRGKTVTGLTYIRQRHGPTVEPTQFLSLCKGMENDGRMKWESRRMRGKTQHRPIVLVPITANHLSAEDIKLLRETAQKLASDNASTVSNKSHRGLAWQIAADKEVLPPFMALGSEAPVHESDFAWARKQIESQ